MVAIAAAKSRIKKKYMEILLFIGIVNILYHALIFL